MLTRAAALALVHEYTASDALRKHMYGVEIAMRAMAEKYGADPELWGVVGLVHDFDYERFPNPEHAPDREHPAEGVGVLAARGLPAEAQEAILGHAAYTGVPRTTPLARALFAVDELSGFLVACALVRPSRSLADLEVPSVKKKLKDKAFARGVSREDVYTGATELGLPLEELIAFLLAALRPHEKVLGLGAP
ncbi:MAG TPA: HD domain-containing protein [Gemmatimonadales bacterium]|jgi:putative nucleotidyltransferase with HDIG domain|nr:HD domain-containing protein [Gemmatimonadales bacterium]